MKIKNVYPVLALVIVGLSQTACDINIASGNQVLSNNTTTGVPVPTLAQAPLPPLPPGPVATVFPLPPNPLAGSVVRSTSSHSLAVPNYARASNFYFSAPAPAEVAKQALIGRKASAEPVKVPSRSPASVAR